MLAHLLDQARQLVRTRADTFRHRLLCLSRPVASTSLVLGTTADLLRNRSELVAENALLSQQLIVLARSAKRPRLARRETADSDPDDHADSANEHASDAAGQDLSP
jgi:hypothetical protein